MVTNLTSSLVAIAQHSHFFGGRNMSIRSNAATTHTTHQGAAPKTATQPRSQFVTTLLRALSAVAA